MSKKEAPDTLLLEEVSGGSPKADHLCVLVHGLWGNPKHLVRVAKALRDKYSHDELHLLLAKSNSSDLTYDGIELGGERVCFEIEEEIKAIEKRGGSIKKLSILGYSLGGLVSRYAVGMLYAKGVLDKVECKNFITFASPHLGARSPLNGVGNTLFNLVGARTLSESGRQLFVCDKFRDTGRPLLAVLADPTSIFISGLRKFERRALYTNIVNDRSAAYYTTGITKTDPYNNLDNLELNYLSDYPNVILDREDPFVQHSKPVHIRTTTTMDRIRKLPRMLAWTALIPIGLSVFLTMSVFKTLSSTKRMELHEAGKGGVDITSYRVPLQLKELRNEVEQAYRDNAGRQEQYLESGPGSGSSTEDELSPPTATAGERLKSSRTTSQQQHRKHVLKRERRLSQAAQPTLALAPEQFEMIDALDSVGWRKHAVHIQHDRHSHAAIIVRFEKATFDEGYVVLKHLVDGEFLA